jgi:hypothetical protein
LWLSLLITFLCSAAARLVFYDVIDGTVLDDIRKHDERQAALQKMASLAEGDERSPVRNITPPQPKEGMRTGRKSRAGSGIGGGLGFGASDNPLGRSSSSVSDPTPISELHERLTQEAIVELELEAFTLFKRISKWRKITKIHRRRRNVHFFVVSLEK